MNISKSTKIRIALAAATLILVLTLVILGISALVRPVMGLLGFDLTDYDGEEIKTEMPTDSPEALKICETVSMLLYSPNPEIHEFEGADEAATLYTDSILSYMMSKNYSKYVCNIELLSRATDSYSNYNFRTLIPAADFRSEMYRAFGGSRAVSERSGDAFTFHERIDSFSLVGSPHIQTARVMPISFGLAEHSYKLVFSVSSEKGISDEYIATCISREDETVYIKSIKKLAS